MITDVLKNEEIDMLMVPPSINFFYLFKGYLGLSERLICGILSPSEDSILIAPSFEKENMQIQTTFDEIVTWKEEENPYLILKKALSSRPKKIALEPSTPFEIYKRLKHQFPEAAFVDAGPIINVFRSVKTDEEIQRMVKASEDTATGIASALDIIHAGQTELEILKIVQDQMTLNSGEMGWALVQIDENSAVPHGKASDKKLKLDSVILIDAGTSCDYYFADITVTSVHGKPSQEFLDVYEIVEEANNTALEVSTAGGPAEQGDFAAREVID